MFPIPPRQKHRGVARSDGALVIAPAATDWPGQGYASGVLDDADARASAGAVLDALYAAAEACDLAALRAALRPDVFVLTATDDGVLTSADAVADDITRWSTAAAAGGGALRLRATRRTVGVSASRRGAWVFDDLVAETARRDGATCSVAIRLTALLSSDDGWQVAAAYWSVPFPTQGEQDAVKHAGQLRPGRVLTDGIGEGTAKLAARLRDALAEPRQLPDLYSAGDDHVTVGSVVDEVFLGGEGRAAWSEFVQHVTTFVPRGGIRAALAAPDVAWLATNIDISNPPTPYRFFYIWALADAGWHIVVSHDAVSRDPVRAAATASRARHSPVD